jgi:di/tricarboxylate transporter
MTQDQAIIFAILAATIAMFMWGRWRHDMIATLALLACVLAGLVPDIEAFVGFGHPAVITVACVLVLSRGLQTTGAVDALAQRILPTSAGPTFTIAALTGLAATLSAFMNNVGAMALLMPVAIQIAARQKLPPGKVLMPLAFGSILGGMTTLIGTPPNLIVSSFRSKVAEDSFGMFDFTPVGLAVAVAGVVFVALLGWRLVPTRERAGAESFDTGTYLTEARVTKDSKAAGKTLREVEEALEEADAQVIGLARNAFRLSAPYPGRILQPDDILVIEAEPESLSSALSSLGLKIEGDMREKPAQKDKIDEKTKKNQLKDAEDATTDDKSDKKTAESSEIILLELVVRPDAHLIGLTATDIRLRVRYGINLIAISNQGQRSISRLRTTQFQASDVLLVQGESEALSGFASEFGCVPLAERSIRIPDRRQAIIAMLVMAAAVGGAAFGLLPAAISFAAGVIAYMALRVIPLRTVYDAIDWPVIVLLGALIPVAGAMATTGAADLLAQLLLQNIAQGNAIVALAMILVVTMTLSDFMNNAATAAVMAPISLSTAAQLSVNPDSFLMAVAIGASCAFLTPIGHQNNTLILGPGGFRFGDYWRLGLPLEIIVTAVSIPMLLIVWPL